MSRVKSYVDPAALEKSDECRYLIYIYKERRESHAKLCCVAIQIDYFILQRVYPPNYSKEKNLGVCMIIVWVNRPFHFFTSARLIKKCAQILD